MEERGRSKGGGWRWRRVVEEGGRRGSGWGSELRTPGAPRGIRMGRNEAQGSIHKQPTTTTTRELARGLDKLRLPSRLASMTALDAGLTGSGNNRRTTTTCSLPTTHRTSCQHSRHSIFLALTASVTHPRAPWRSRRSTYITSTFIIRLTRLAVFRFLRAELWPSLLNVLLDLVITDQHQRTSHATQDVRARALEEGRGAL